MNGKRVDPNLYHFLEDLSNGFLKNKPGHHIMLRADYLYFRPSSGHGSESDEWISSRTGIKNAIFREDRINRRFGWVARQPLEVSC